MSKDCPTCGLVNPDTAEVCDCGYSFRTRRVVSTGVPRWGLVPKLLDVNTLLLFLVGILTLVSGLALLAADGKVLPNEPLDSRLRPILYLTVGGQCVAWLTMFGQTIRQPTRFPRAGAALWIGSYVVLWAALLASGWEGTASLAPFALVLTPVALVVGLAVVASRLSRR